MLKEVSLCLAVIFGNGKIVFGLQTLRIWSRLQCLVTQLQLPCGNSFEGPAISPRLSRQCLKSKRQSNSPRYLRHNTDIEFRLRHFAFDVYTPSRTNVLLTCNWSLGYLRYRLSSPFSPLLKQTGAKCHTWCCVSSLQLSILCTCVTMRTH